MGGTLSSSLGTVQTTKGVEGVQEVKGQLVIDWEDGEVCLGTSWKEAGCKLRNHHLVLLQGALAVHPQEKLLHIPGL